MSLTITCVSAPVRVSKLHVYAIEWLILVETISLSSLMTRIGLSRGAKQPECESFHDDRLYVQLREYETANPRIDMDVRLIVSNPISLRFFFFKLIESYERRQEERNRLWNLSRLNDSILYFRLSNP